MCHLLAVYVAEIYTLLSLMIKHNPKPKTMHIAPCNMYKHNRIPKNRIYVIIHKTLQKRRIKHIDEGCSAAAEEAAATQSDLA